MCPETSVKEPIVEPQHYYDVATESQQHAIAQIKAKLERTFTSIQQQRMQDVPIMNDKLKVQAVDFKPWQDSYIGVLITPWFMNLMLLPNEHNDWHELVELRRYTHRFPSGNYSFICGHEKGLGTYQACSLFSPMFEFADQQAAVDTAKAVMQELLNEEHQETPDIDSAQIQGIWEGSIEHPDKASLEQQANTLKPAQKQAVLEQKSLKQKLETPISRRQLLRGQFFGEDEQ